MSKEIKFNDLLKKIVEEDKMFTQHQLIKLYGLYKQSVYGDNYYSMPSFINLKDYVMWEEWNKHKGKSNKDCEKEFIEYYNLINII